jgi:hypothetical protein
MFTVREYVDLRSGVKAFVDQIARIALRFWADDTYHIVDTRNQFIQLLNRVRPNITHNPEFLTIYLFTKLALKHLFALIDNHVRFFRQNWFDRHDRYDGDDDRDNLRDEPVM